ncbi:MAG: Si-specific NAD(P)(+) transhydrogenase [Candidatus Rokubacteria bacterium]|nr:Si-specific NAD(P)(+) transhydrogenase [Candidatus Rokubacteria bacterium]
MERYDLVVIGAGPAGEKGAAQAAYFGKHVAVVERQPYVGGAGINTGTIPSKTLRETALYFSGLTKRGLYGVDYTVKPDLTVRDFMYREREVVAALRTKAAENLARHGVTVAQGLGSFEDPHTIRVRSDDQPDRLLGGTIILIATGSRPHRAPEIPFDDRLILDSDTVLRMDRLPRSLAVVGAGVIGCEYASMFCALGIEVTLLGGRDRVLPFLDHEISDHLRLQMEQLGIRVRLGTSVERYEPSGDSVRLGLSNGDPVGAEKVLVAAGRLGNTEGLDLGRVGLAPDPRGLLKANEHYQTTVPHIYAAGDVIGFPALAAVSMEQARVAVCHAFDFRYKTEVSPLLPLAVYTIPEVAMAGETEETCQQKHIPYCVGRAFYENNARGQIIGDLAGEVKLVFSPGDQTLLGVHVIGEAASELVHVGQVCLQLGGTLDFFIQTVFNYPTLGEAYKYAAYDGLQNLARLTAGEQAPPSRAPLPDERRRP